MSVLPEHGQPQPERCPIEWCTRRGPVKPGHGHLSRMFGDPDTVYVLIDQLPPEQPSIKLSGWEMGLPILSLRADEARMLATLAVEPVAAALRQAADELDRITSGSGGEG